MNGDTFRKFADKMARQIEQDIFSGASPSTYSTASTNEPPELSIKSFEDMLKALTPIPPPLEFFSSTFAVERDGDRPEKFKRSWKERLFSRPWTPWVTEKTIMVPNYKPAIYRVGDKIVYHPALEDRVRAIVANAAEQAPKLGDGVGADNSDFRFYRGWTRSPFIDPHYPWTGGA